jgi:hypothetical protein
MVETSQIIKQIEQIEWGNKFKNLRRVLRQWQVQISNLAKTIEDNKMMI